MRESKKNYDKNYVITKCKRYTLILNKEYDKDIIKFLSTKDNVNGYLKELIRREMK